MRPKQHEMTGSSDLFRTRLDQIINLKHELVQLATLMKAFASAGSMIRISSTSPGKSSSNMSFRTSARI